MQVIWAEQALIAGKWRNEVRVRIGDDGRIASVTAGSGPEGMRVGALLPAPVNLHSHAFQRAMAGMTERRGPDPRDSFWTWRQLMYRFLDRLSPDDIEAITAFVPMEMLEAGYAGVAEFHYLHHQADGRPYDDIAELSARVVAAADRTGIGLTLLPVFYQFGGCDGRALGQGQIRFGNDFERFSRLAEGAGKFLQTLPDDANLGIAPHSLRAVGREGLKQAATLRPDAPFHMHLAEQVAEVEEVQAHWGARPVEWLLANATVGQRWCLIHCTQMQPHETRTLAESGAVAGLCPITESSLGDGIFDGVSYQAQGGKFGVGSDSNIRISLSEELRTLEYSQRLRDRSRAAMAGSSGASTGRTLFDGITCGGAQAAGRPSGCIEPGRHADLMSLDLSHPDLADRHGDAILDSYIFAGDDRMVSEVWAAGRHLVQSGRHIAREQIQKRYCRVMQRLRDDI